jgi:hypothetical protein
MVAPLPSPGTQLIEVMRLRDQINSLARALLPSRSPAFGSVSLPLPDLESAPELTFIRTGSWLYVHYFEVGRVSVRFLARRNPAAKGQEHGHEHLGLVHAIRTWSQHSIDPASPHDVGIAETCETWFKRACGTRLPRTDEHWRTLVYVLLADAQSFLRLLLDMLSAIEGDGDRDVICQQWEERLKRDWPANRYHDIIQMAAVDLGRVALDPVAFYNRHGHVIREGLQLLSENCDFESEARKLVERSILTESGTVLPITGRDIMIAFNISPGPQVGHLLERASYLYQEHPSDRENLLQSLQKFVDESGGNIA